MKLSALALALTLTLTAAAQQPSPSSSPSPDPKDARSAEILELRSELARISARLDALEHTGEPLSTSAPPLASPAPEQKPKAAAAQSASADPNSIPASPVPAPTADSAAATTISSATADRQTLDFFHGTTINFALDGYYEYNFDQPVGRVNLLRAYDVSSNSFSINQADIVIERLPVASEGQRFGGRIDLQFGQATETLGGNSANEQRPQVWRNLYQAYGSYLAPVGSGLRLDFGKFASALGSGGNYTKDQMNYSRSFLFNYLPYYHTGLRSSYDLSPKANITYWLVNGAEQTEDFNGFKSQGFITTLKPAKNLSWNINYYFGQEQRDVAPTLNPVLPTSPTQPGLPTSNISPAPNGREHIFDTYAAWSATSKLTLQGEADFIVNRTFAQSPEQHTAAGSVHLKYLLPRSTYVAGRFEYFDDRSGLFSNTSQALKEGTFTFNRQMAPGFLLFLEYRRDWSNRPFFYTDTAGSLTGAQPTATVGLVYWWGMKQGAW